MNESQGTSLADRVVRGAAWSTGVTVISLPLAVVTTLVLARTLGVKGFGALSLYTFVTGLIFGLSELGLGSALIQRAAFAVGRGDERDILSSVQAAVTWSLVRLPFIVATGFLVLPDKRSALVYAVAVSSNLACIGPSYYLVSTSNLELPSKLRLVSSVISAASSIAVAIGTHDAALTFAVTALTTNITTGLQAFGVPRVLRARVLLPGRLTVDRSDIAFGLGSFLNGHLAGFVFSRSELLFFGTGAEIPRGRFAAAETIAARSTLALDALFGALPSAMASAAGRGTEALVQAFARVSRTVLALLGLTAPSLAVLVVTAAPPAFGHGYSGVGSLALVLAGASLLQTGTYPLGLLRYAERKIAPLLLAGAAAAALDAALSLWLIPQRGVAGAVLANVVSGACYVAISAALLCTSQTWRRPALSHTIRASIIVCASLACGALGLAFRNPWWATAGGLAAALPVTLLLMQTIVPADEFDVPTRAREPLKRLRLIRRAGQRS